jgi:DNA-directed RNA polymerase specialized sigma24 family protein
VACDHGVIEYGYHLYDEDDKIKDRVTITLSFWDLHGSLRQLSARKREAVFYNVILDWKQKDVAKRMGISTVSVGQYVQAAMEQLAVALDLSQTIVGDL